MKSSGCRGRVADDDAVCLVRRPGISCHGRYGRRVSFVRRVFVTLDSAAPQPVAEFWAAMLDGELVFATEQAVGVRAEQLWLSAIHVDGYRPPTWPDDAVPKQIHLDLDVEDLEAAVAAAERLGAVATEFQPAPEARRIMLDPAGHPFCLTTGVPKIEAGP
jgi:hypothetical protein